jgi:hypothetical protein
MPVFMVILCSVIIMGFWLEHLLLLAPALSHDVDSLPLNLTDALITVGFFGLMVMAVGFFLKRFPEIAGTRKADASA